MNQYPLTPRERELTKCLATGYNLPQAAKQMGIAYGTAKNFLMSAKRKTASPSALALVRWYNITYGLPK